MPDFNDPNMDPRVKQYLDKLRMGSQDTSMDQTAIDAHNAQVSNSLIDSLAASGAQMGSIGGRVADTSALNRQTEQLNRAQQDISKRQADTARMRQDDTMKVYEYLANQAQQEAAAKSKSAADLAAEERAFDRQKFLKGMEIAGQKNMYNLKTPAAEAAFNALPKEQQRMVTDLGAKNANKQSIVNQIRSSLQQFQNAPNDLAKERIGKQMLKTVNSAEGADAIGAEEAARLGEALENYTFNVISAAKGGRLSGRDLPGFENQVIAQINSIEQGIDANNAVIKDIYSGKAPVRTALESKLGKSQESDTAIAGPQPELPPFDPDAFLKGMK